MKLCEKRYCSPCLQAMFEAGRPLSQHRNASRPTSFFIAGVIFDGLPILHPIELVSRNLARNFEIPTRLTFAPSSRRSLAIVGALWSSMWWRIPSRLFNTKNKMVNVPWPPVFFSTKVEFICKMHISLESATSLIWPGDKSIHNTWRVSAQAKFYTLAPSLRSYNWTMINIR